MYAWVGNDDNDNDNDKDEYILHAKLDNGNIYLSDSKTECNDHCVMLFLQCAQEIL